MMRIGIDTISAGRGFAAAAGGMVVYLPQIVRALARRSPGDDFVVFATPAGARTLGPPTGGVRIQVCRAPRCRPGRVLYEQLVYPALIARAGLDVFLGTCNVLPLATRCPQVVVLQSLQYLLFPRIYPWVRRTYLRTAVRLSVLRAAGVIAVSEAARQDAVRLLDVPASKVHVVHHGVSEVIRAEAAALGNGAWRALVERRVGRSPYFLAVSSLYEFKNHRRLVRAFAEAVRRSGAPYDLVVVGEDADLSRVDLETLAASLGVGGRLRCLGGVDHRGLAALYLGATALVYPSLYETFGHPVLEAMVCGCAVVTSRTGAPAELAGAAARLVDPYSVEDIAAGMVEMLDPRARAARRDMAFVRASGFTWERAAEETLAVLGEAARIAPAVVSDHVAGSWNA